MAVSGKYVCDHCPNGSGACACGPSDDCPLRGVTVAVVGGLERMEPAYREVVQKLGGQCLCHTGHMKKGGRHLRNLVSKADLVVCHTSVNSHGAMHALKKECKKCRKPFCALRGQGASALMGCLLEQSA